jgi:hypothetical protein
MGLELEIQVYEVEYKQDNGSTTRQAIKAKEFSSETRGIFLNK